ncbi:uncharacterized protein JN550_007942 [Neoarthrinium moseri]|uniref:uncharacterized protein n=1 Tax=Neoarthrinium moseri TaxID=1658444 RepID=UPI001FDE7FC7|nr:uncharacterized protein JN550_007942 [Neoarthrinium moseri]KAI1865964.1 hypothetical protein JN550_007942 [Neoarthrinium moseri]
MPLSSAQKALVDRFAARTGADKKKAERFLKNANFDFDAAIRAGERRVRVRISWEDVHREAADLPVASSRNVAGLQNLWSASTAPVQLCITFFCVPSSESVFVTTAIPGPPSTMSGQGNQGHPGNQRMPGVQVFYRGSFTPNEEDWQQNLKTNLSEPYASTASHLDNLPDPRPRLVHFNAPAVNVSETALKNQFESLRNPSEDPVDTIGTNGSMEYLSSLGINFEDASMFVALWVLESRIGELKKDDFVRAWKKFGVQPKLEDQQTHMAVQTKFLAYQMPLFRDVYRHAFVAGKEPDARALPVEAAITFWEVIFKDPGLPWVGKQTGINWLSLWISFLKEKWTRTVSKDMWNMTLEFALKSRDDETLSFWSEDGAWPGVIDDFVAWYREKRASGTAMDVDS